MTPMDVARPLEKSDGDIDVRVACVPRGISKHSCRDVAVIRVHLRFVRIRRRQLQLLCVDGV